MPISEYINTHAWFCRDKKNLFTGISLRHTIRFWPEMIVHLGHRKICISIRMTDMMTAADSS
ncbi:MAG: hypothetical protein M1493_11500 [Firmicutes bacterium]|nr:hypothetical protein [Bacillota bacterium]